MPHVRRSALPLLIGSFVAGCSSMSNGVATLQARGAVHRESDSYYHESRYGYGVEGGGNLALRSYGLRASINTPIVDVIGGADEHRFEGQHISEASLGLRKRFPASDAGAFYVEAAIRRGFGLDTLSGRRDYDGMESGFGGIFQLGDHWFLDVGFSVEWTLGQLNLASGRDHLSEVLFNVGLGFSL